MAVKISAEIRHLIEDMIKAERARYGAPGRMSDTRAFRRAYDEWFRSVS